jgi:hypothetical protein
LSSDSLLAETVNLMKKVAVDLTEQAVDKLAAFQHVKQNITENWLTMDKASYVKQVCTF